MKGGKAWPEAITAGMAAMTRRKWPIMPMAVPMQMAFHLPSLVSVQTDVKMGMA